MHIFIIFVLQLPGDVVAVGALLHHHEQVQAVSGLQEEDHFLPCWHLGKLFKFEIRLIKIRAHPKYQPQF